MRIHFSHLVVVGLLVLVATVGLEYLIDDALAGDREVLGKIDGAAIDIAMTDCSAGYMPRVGTFSLFAANDDPADVLDKIFLINFDGTVTDSFPSPCSSPQALMTGFLVGDPVAVTVYVSHDEPGDSTDLIYHYSLFLETVIDSFPASGIKSMKNPRGLVEEFSQITIIWPGWTEVCSEFVARAWIASGDSLCLINLMDGSLVRTIPAPCSSPQGLEMGMTLSDLFVACDDTDMLYLIDKADGAVISSYPLPFDNVSGLAAATVGATHEDYSETIPFSFYQGENIMDTMERMNAQEGSYMGSRIFPECCPGGEVGACCVARDRAIDCYEVTETQCDQLGGDFKGVGTNCDDRSNICTVGVTSDPMQPAPGRFALRSYPNPFNPKTTISFRVSEAMELSLVLHDLTGRRIVTLADGFYEVGEYTVSWSGTNSRGDDVSSGVYLAKVRGDGTEESVKLILAR